MKKFYLYPICLIPMGAFAATTFYYDRGGVCDGLFLNPNATLCSQAVTRVSIPTVSKNTFAGYWAGDTKVIDATGNILIGRTVASQLFESSSDNADKIAIGGFYGGGEVLVKKRQNWKDMQDGWYTCSAISFQKCAEYDTFYLPYAPNCWTRGSAPNNDGYDYVFNSWRMANGDFRAASTDWHDQYPNGVSTGNSYISNGCVSTYLGDISGGVSDNNIYPFACKLFAGTRGGTWSTTKSVDHGTITLDNSFPGQCHYDLTCETGYHVSSGNSSNSCTGTQCKTMGSPDNLSLGTCVVDEPTFTCPDVPSNWDPNGTLTRTVNTNSCTYIFHCNSNFHIDGDTTIITCTGNECTDDWLSLYTVRHCVVSCPSKNLINNQLPGKLTMTAEPERIGYDTCQYTVGCNNMHYALTPVDNIYSCVGDDCTLGILADAVSNRYSCEVQPITCPTKAELQPSMPEHIAISEPDQNIPNECDYTISCGPDAYLVQYGSTDQVYCWDDFNGTYVGCTVPLIRQSVVDTNRQCAACPSAASLGTLEHGTVEYIGVNGDNCRYRLSCDEGLDLFEHIGSYNYLLEQPYFISQNIDISRYRCDK